jgi:hypothetical protein
VLIMSADKWHTEIARIVEAQRLGRQRMDDYCAVFVRSDGSVSTSGTSPMIFYRKDVRFRTDSVVYPVDISRAAHRVLSPSGVSAGNGNDRSPHALPKREEIGRWWHNRVRDLVLAPIYINHGLSSFRIEKRFVADPDGSTHLEIAAVEDVHGCAEPPHEPLPAYWSWRPEFACRRLLGMPGENMDVDMDMDPADGPPGTILLRFATRRSQALSDSGHSGPYCEWQCWFDPTRDYIDVRSDIISQAEACEATMNSTVIEETARSPNGTWYATRIRRMRAIRDSRGHAYDEIVNLYLDFSVDLPDSLFDLPAVGHRIH